MTEHDRADRTEKVKSRRAAIQEAYPRGIDGHPVRSAPASRSAHLANKMRPGAVITHSTFVLVLSGNPFPEPCEVAHTLDVSWRVRRACRFVLRSARGSGGVRWGGVIPGKPVHVNTRLYKVVHGHEPRGVRSWGFTMGDRTGAYWVSQASYSEAKRKALRHARKQGVDYITVLP